MAQLALKGLFTCVNPVVGFQLVLQAELLPTPIALVGLFPGVDALVTLQSTLVTEAAPAELTLVWVVTCVRPEMALQCRVAREGSVTFAADVAADTSVHFHVLLQRDLCLETLPTKQAEDRHVSTGVGLSMTF